MLPNSVLQRLASWCPWLLRDEPKRKQPVKVLVTGAWVCDSELAGNNRTTVPICKRSSELHCWMDRNSEEHSLIEQSGLYCAGQIGYAIVPMIARGLMLGPDQPVVLHMLDIPRMADALNGVRMELVDAALPLLRGP